MKWPGVGQSRGSEYSAYVQQGGAMSTLGRSKDRTLGVALRPGMDVSALRTAWEDRRLLNGINRKFTRWFGRLSGSVLLTFITDSTPDWFAESPRLSSASISSNERAPSATPSWSDLPSAGQRPVSLVSTLSSGSGSSRDDSPAPPRPGVATPPTGADDIDLELSPQTGAGEQDHPSAGEAISRGGTLFRLNDSATDRGVRKHPLSPFAAEAMAPNPKLTYVDRVVMEIIETERMYVRDLRSIVEDYLAHIIDQADLPMRPEQVCALFGNIEDIYEFNSELLQSLDMCDNDPVAIAKCFVMKREYFDIYTQYCTNYPNSVAALTDCMRNKSLAKFFRERQASLKRSLPLGSYLLKPVQRILKYHLLLQEIAKHFDPEEEGYEVVEEAIYTMTHVAWYINDMKRKHEHAVRLQEVQSLLINWKGPDLTTYGELVLEGTFKVHRAKNERTLFLFDRMLLISKRRGEHYVYKTHISCSTLMLIESAKDSLCFSVTHYKHPKQPHTVQAKTVEERKLWAHHIKRIILENHQAIIPQKAKEAILEMDSIYPNKYRYSPERMKKTISCQSDEFPREGRQGRRQSEPTKQILKSTKAILKDEERSNMEENVCYKENGLSSLPVLQSGNEQSASIAEKNYPFLQTTPDKSLLQSKTTDPDSTERPKPAPSNPEDAFGPAPRVFTTPTKVCTTPTKVCTTSPRVEAPEPQGDKEEDQMGASPASQSDDMKTLSSAESSEEEEEEAVIQEGQPSSILPPSVLNQASAIAEHFTNTARRGSTDDARSIGCPSPRLPSRNGSALSLSVEVNDRSIWLNSTCPETPQDNLFGVDLTMHSPRDDSLFEIHRRRDSTLSKKDQLLIDKIKTYYETAEHQDANFSLRRRESLTYIPTGLVKNSVSRFNCSDETPGVEKSEPSVLATSSAPHPSTSATDSPDAPGAWDCMVSSASFNSLDLEKSKKPEVVCSEADRKDKPLSLQDEEFRPSSEMIKVWQDMEKKGNKSQEEARGLVKTTRVASPSLCRRSQTPKENSELESDNSLIILEEADLSTITEESMSPSPVKCKALGLSRKPSGRDPHRSRLDEGRLPRVPQPRIIQLRAEERVEANEAPQSLDDEEMAKNKVFQLARQYSQRIKSPSPAPRQRDVLLGKKNLPCVIEEKLESSGKPNLTLPLLSFDRMSTAQEVSPNAKPPSPAPTPSSLGSPRVLSPGRTQAKSPLSPTPAEVFNWPNVQTLRSKYASSNKDQSQLPSFNRSRSVPERMNSGPKRRSSFSSSFVASCGTVEVPAYRPHLTRDCAPDEALARLHRAGSLDKRLSGLHLNDLQNLKDKVPASGYYVSAQATMPNDHKVLVVEKLPEPGPEPSSAEPLEIVLRAKRVEVVEDVDDSYVQIRSPTSREKISIMAVIDRCRAYQESDEYRQREEGGAKADSVSVSGRGKETIKGLPSNEQLDDAHKTVTNLVKKTEASNKHTGRYTSGKELDKGPTSDKQLDTAQKAATTSEKKTNASQQSKVKNLRQKFLNLQ
ncbi:pleckstrin homology domain-containing family G member 3 isoform X6 [Esox lucius]|uniref:pleckstrin homology domain-containing family G member 3 isoform X6 n=1 Tax=Esox lucius TaxID=8010 RepID=UPI00147725FC|nr:pleckstrin homology domain-containing family G member 3 isoform X6 [Esox lucius]